MTIKDYPDLYKTIEYLFLRLKENKIQPFGAPIKRIDEIFHNFLQAEIESIQTKWNFIGHLGTDSSEIYIYYHPQNRYIDNQSIYCFGKNSKDGNYFELTTNKKHQPIDIWLFFNDLEKPLSFAKEVDASITDTHTFEESIKFIESITMKDVLVRIEVE